MSRTIIAAAREIRAEIRSQEDNIDATLAGQARLVGALLDARRAANVPARVGADVLDRAFEAIDHGRKLRESMLAMHKELAQMNLRELAAGDVSECPPDESFGVFTLVRSGETTAIGDVSECPPDEGFGGLTLVASGESKAA